MKKVILQLEDQIENCERGIHWEEKQIEHYLRLVEDHKSRIGNFKKDIEEYRQALEVCKKNQYFG